MNAVPSTIDEHAEEAAFLWQLRDGAVGAPDYTLEELTELDERVEAHLDGLRLAGETGWQTSRDGLVWQEGGEAFAAAVLAVESGDRQRFNTVLDVCAENSVAARGMVSAMAWVPFRLAEPWVFRLIGASTPELNRLGIAAGAAHRLLAGQVLEQALGTRDARLRGRTFRAIGQLGVTEFASSLLAALADDDVKCRLSAAWALGLLGSPDGTRVFQNAVQRGEAGQDEVVTALRLIAAGKAGVSQAQGWQRDLASDPRFRRSAVIGAGIIGEPGAIPWLIAQMDLPCLARVAGEAVTMITGSDLGDLRRDPPEGFHAGPTDDAEDEDVSMDPDEALPWPDPALVDRWWQSIRGRFESGQRYLAGEIVTETSLMNVLQTGTQRQRAAAAIELALLHPRRPLFEVRAPGFRQAAMLGHRNG